MTTLRAPERAHTPDLLRSETEAVDAGALQTLADLEAEDRDPDPFIAACQDDRDRCAGRGDLERAWDAQAAVEDLRHASHHVDIDDVEMEV